MEAHPERGPEHPHTLAVMETLAAVYNQTARFAEAEAMGREVLARKTRVFGAESPAVAIALNNLAVTQAHRGHIQDAEGSFAESRRLYAKLLGPEHWETANAARNVARMLEMQERYREALPLMREAWDVARRRDDDGGRSALGIGGQLGVLLVRTGARAEGLSRLRRAYAELHAMFPAGHMHVADTAVALTRALLAGSPTPDELAEAERLSRHAVEIHGAQLAPDHPTGPLLRDNLPALERWGMADRADLREARRRLAALESPPSRPTP
jgi:hypothetical protein